jgi:hypothetical protein
MIRSYKKVCMWRDIGLSLVVRLQKLIVEQTLQRVSGFVPHASNEGRNMYLVALFPFLCS